MASNTTAPAPTKKHPNNVEVGPEAHVCSQLGKKLIRRLESGHGVPVDADFWTRKKTALVRDSVGQDREAQ